MIYWIWIFIDDFLFDSLLSTVLTFACLLMPWHCHGKRVQRRVWRAEGCAQREGLNKRSLLKSVCFREGLQCPQWSSFFIRKKINGGVFFRCHMDFFEEFFILSTLGIPIIFSCSSDRNKRFTPPTTHHPPPDPNQPSSGHPRSRPRLHELDGVQQRIHLYSSISMQWHCIGRWGKKMGLLGDPKKIQSNPGCLF